MSITITLEPELEDLASAKAAVRRVTVEELDALLDELAEGSENEPVPPVLTRAEIYADHD